MNIRLLIQFQVTDYSASLDIAVKQQTKVNDLSAAMLFVMPYKNIPLTRVSCMSNGHYPKGEPVPRQLETAMQLQLPRDSSHGDL